MFSSAVRGPETAEMTRDPTGEVQMSDVRRVKDTREKDEKYENSQLAFNKDILLRVEMQTSVSLI